MRRGIPSTASWLLDYQVKRCIHVVPHILLLLCQNCAIFCYFKFFFKCLLVVFVVHLVLSSIIANMSSRSQMLVKNSPPKQDSVETVWSLQNNSTTEMQYISALKFQQTNLKCINLKASFDSFKTTVWLLYIHPCLSENNYI